jgi:hypothetical protein
MRVITFNTFLSPTMQGRFARKLKINRAIHYWLIEGVDVIGLQEVNSFTLGFLGWVYFYFQLYRFLHEQLARIVDALIIVEGFIFPWYIYNNSQELEHIVKQHNTVQLDKTQKYYIYKSDVPSRGISAGVISIVKFKPDLVRIENLVSDFIHNPGYICLKYQNNIIFNAHFVPNLPNHTAIYAGVNWLNEKLSINTKQIRVDNISASHLAVSSMSSHLNDNILMIGDYNIDRESESNLYQVLLRKFELIDSALAPICTQQSLYGCIQQYQQIDYILSTQQPTRNCKILEYLFQLSDHHAIDAEY